MGRRRTGWSGASCRREEMGPAAELGRGADAQGARGAGSGPGRAVAEGWQNWAVLSASTYARPGSRKRRTSRRGWPRMRISPFSPRPLGWSLKSRSMEASVGPFSADILCRDTGSPDGESWVLVENQLERTDHRHLGQLLTYAAGLHTVTIIWIAQRFTDEHRAALDWLNEITGELVRRISGWRSSCGRSAIHWQRPNSTSCQSRTSGLAGWQHERRVGSTLRRTLLDGASGPPSMST